MSTGHKRIEGLIGLARARVRFQRVVEGLSTGLVASLLVAMVPLVLTRTGWMTAEGMWQAWLASLVFPVAGLVWAFASRISPEALATRIDTENALKARLTTSYCFLQVPEAERTDFMRAAIADAEGHLAGIKVAPAVPFSFPHSGLAFFGAAAALALLVLVRPPVARGMLPEEEPVPVVEAILSDEDVAIMKEELEALKEELKDSDNPEVEELLARMQDLIEKVDEREIKKEEFITEVDEIKDKFFEPKNEEWKQLLEEMGKVEDELEKDANTKALAEALKEGDMEKAARELEKLGEKIANGEMSDKDIDKLAKRLEKLAKQFENDSEKLAQALKEKEKELEALKKKLEDKAKDMSPEDKKRLSRLERQLKDLKGQKDQFDASGKGKSLKKLSRAMKEGGEKVTQTKKKGPGAAKKKEDRAQAQDEFKKAMSAAAAETQDVGKKAETGKGMDKAERQLDKMKERLRRQAGQEDAKAKQDREAFSEKAKGQQQQKPGGQQGPKAEKKPGEQGTQAQKTSGAGKDAKGDPNDPGEQPENMQQGEVEGNVNARSDGTPQGDLLGEGQGKGKGDRSLGEETDMKDKKVVDSKVDGQQGDGPTSSEVIESASQRGFASTPYRKAYEYEKAVAEEVLEDDTIPPGYRFYVERYFEEIRPRDVVDAP